MTMQQPVVLRYDGESLKPEQPVSLKTNGQFSIEVEEVEENTNHPNPVFARIIARAEPMGITDLAEQHDHYLYGVPKH